MTPWADLFVQGLVQGLGFWLAGGVVAAGVALVICAAHARGPR